ncbi:hypothetical protein ACA910_005717 [Epithemia clementina (nom. ined.)]
MKIALENVKNQIIQGFEDLFNKLDQSTIQMTSRMEALEKSGVGLGVPSTTVRPSGGAWFAVLTTVSTLTNADTDHLHVELQELRSALERISIDMQRICSKVDSTAIKFGDLGVASYDDCRAWVTQNFRSQSSGLLFDICLVLEHCASPEAGDINAMLTSMEKQHKLEIRTSSKTKVFFSMKLEIPQILYKDLQSTLPDPSFLTSMKSHKDWSAPETGVQSRILNRMGGMHNMFGDLISNTMAEEPQARALASMMLYASLTCTQELVSYIDESMLQLTKCTGYTEQKAFSLVTQVV